jgi:branched-chain amino acid transport system permease protein
VSSVEAMKEVTDPATTPASATRPAPQWRRLAPWAVLACGLALGIALQTQLYPAQVRLASTVFMWVALASAWNLIGGFTGYACFGQVGFFGLGAYLTALLMVHLHWSFWLAMPLSAVSAGLFAALVGAPLLRLKGHYFAVATLCVAEGLREVVVNTKATGGGGGISIPAVGKDAPTPWLGNDGFYVLFLLIAVTVVGVSIFLASSRGGYALRAIHQDEDAAAAMGINTTVAKTLAFALSAALTGGVGAAYGFQLQAIYPIPIFSVGITVLMVVMVVIGGMGSVFGPVVGAIAIAFVSEWLRENYTDIHPFMLGCLIVVAVILLPQGFVNYLRDAMRRQQFSLLDNVRRYRL